MHFNFDDGKLEDDGLSAEDLEKIESIRDFFFTNFKSSEDPENCEYLSTVEVYETLIRAFPGSKLQLTDVDTWLTSNFRRKDVGSGYIKIVWAISRKIW